MQRDKLDIESSLALKGFQRDERHHHFFLYRTQKGLLTPVKTKTSHGSAKMKTLGDSLLGQMARQCRLSKSQFIDLIDCPLSQEDYEKILRRKGVV